MYEVGDSLTFGHTEMESSSNVAQYYAQDGSVDLKGNPVLRSQRGGWFACYFIVGKKSDLICIVVEGFLSLTYSIVVTDVMYVYTQCTKLWRGWRTKG